MRALILLLCAFLSGCPAPPGPGPDSGPTSPSEPTALPPGPLTGRWVGRTSEGMGVVATQVNMPSGDRCVNHYDWQGPLEHAGNILKGRLVATFQGADCTLLDVPASAYPEPSTVVFEITLTPPNGITIPWGDWVGMVGGAAGGGSYPLAGTYTANAITFSGQGTEGRVTWSTEVRLRKE